ncbi:electron transfer flavoprotein subunit beta/FixA family protein [bacterium]|jgi:electron transfer flavoprotein beta subunit|nr:electron transfer flavoprotein subunit beta/FixA family protein [bacterium]
MKIAVCVKQVPDSETRINLAAPSAELDKSGFTRVLNPYDAYAVEEAIQIKDKLGDDTEVTAIIIGGDQVMESVKKDCLAVGCDKAIRITDELDNAEALQIAKVLAAVIKRDNFDLVLCGKQAIDDDSGQVGIMVAELCDMAHVSVITDLEFDSDNFTATREIEGGAEIVKGSLPALLTCQKGLNEPRLPSLPNIMKAGMKPVEVITCADLGIDIPAAHTEITTYTPPAERGECKIIENEDPTAAAKELAKLLREEAKII